MSPSNGSPPEKRDDDIVAAAEYALGLTTTEERVRAAERAARDGAFSGEVTYWQRLAAMMAHETAATEPPERVWHAIRQQMAEPEGDRDERVVEVDAARPARSPRFWRWATVAASGVAAAALVALALVIVTPRPEPLIATLPSQQGLNFVLVVQPDRKRVVVHAMGGADSRGRVPELWLLASGTKPVSIGVIGRGEQGTPLAIPAGYAGQIRAGAKFAVSLEPPGGSPTGAPTGPVIASGPLSRL